MKGQGRSAREIVTDKLPVYGVARKAIMPTSMHCHERYANNRAELSHQPTRVRERGVRRFKSIVQAQRLNAIAMLSRSDPQLSSSIRFLLFSWGAPPPRPPPNLPDLVHDFDFVDDLGGTWPGTWPGTPDIPLRLCQIWSDLVIFCQICVGFCQIWSDLCRIL